MGLSQREMSDSVGDLLGGKTELVPDHNAPHGDPSASDTGAASTDAGCPSNQAADFHQGLCAHACNMTQFVLVVKLTSVRSPLIGQKHKLGKRPEKQKLGKQKAQTQKLKSEVRGQRSEVRGRSKKLKN
jgi:hypothetical protein